MENETITPADVLPGDLLLYSTLTEPEFITPVMDNLKENFGVLVDKLIIFSENSNCTHAALAYKEQNTCVESTMPNVRERSPISIEGYKIDVQRVKNNADGSIVLKYLPPVSKNSKENEPYAYAQATIAALFCLFRMHGMEDSKLRNTVLVFLELLSYPLIKYIDSKISNFQGKESACFCSQLAFLCYEKAAAETGNTDFLIKCPSTTKAGQTLLEWLIERNINELTLAPKTDSNASFTDNDLFENKQLTLDSEEIFSAGLSILRLKDNSFCNSEICKNTQAPVLDTSKATNMLLRLIEKLVPILNTKNNNLTLKDWLIDFQSTFVMPCDLLKNSNLETVGTIQYEQ
ncbi:MAG: hypothetical protein WCQ67_02020 [Treponema sp.]